MENRRVLSVLDRIVHHSTTQLDREQSLAGLIRLLNGKAPSEVLGTVAKRRNPRQAEIDQLKQELREAEKAIERANQSKDAEIRTLLAEITDLRTQVKVSQTQASDQASDCAPDGYYTRAQIKQIIATMFSKDHGVGKALVEKNAEQRRHGAKIPKITEGLLQKWRRDDRYPSWCVEQLKELRPDDLLRTHRWRREEINFVKALWSANPRLSNEQLADACSQQFGCKITDSSIRGVLHRAGLLRDDAA